MKRLTSAALLLASAFSFNAQATPMFSIQALGTLGGDDSVAYGLNDNGQVVGYSQDTNGNDIAFVWDVTRGMQNLGTLGGPNSWAHDINNAGQIVGTSATGFEAQGAGFIYQHGVMSQVIDVTGGTATHYTNTTATRINESGMILGTKDVLEYDATSGNIVGSELSSYLKNADTVTESDMNIVIGMNNHGTYVGSMTVDGDMTRFAETGGRGMVGAVKEISNDVQDIGTLGDTTFAFDINSHGLVSGRSRIDRVDYQYTAFLYSEAEGMTDMGTFGFRSANLRGLNDSNWALGWGSDNFNNEFGDEPVFESFLFNLESQEMFFLNDFLDAGSDFARIDFGYSMNENNDIVGYGTTHDGRREAFLMTFNGVPVSEPSVVLLMLIGLAGAGVARRRVS